MNQTIECTNKKAHLDYIKSTFGGMWMKLRKFQNVLNNQFKGILGKFLQGDAPKAWCLESVIIFLSNMFQFKNANIIHDTPAGGLTEFNFQTMDIDDFIRWAFTLYRFAQSKEIDRGSLGYQVWRDVLAPVCFL